MGDGVVWLFEEVWGVVKFEEVDDVVWGKTGKRGNVIKEGRGGDGDVLGKEGEVELGIGEIVLDDGRDWLEEGIMKVS